MTEGLAKSNRGTHGASGISADDAKCFSTKPIAAINLDDLIAYDTVVDKFSSELPFDVSKNVESQTPIASDMMKRLAADKEGFAKARKGSWTQRYLA